PSQALLNFSPCPLSSCLSCSDCLGALFVEASFCSQLQKSDQHAVFPVRELIDRATGSFPHDSIDDFLLELRRDVWSSKGLHAVCQGGHEMIHEMPDPTGTTSQVPLQALAHHAPAKAGPIRDGGIRVLHAQNPLLDHVKHLAVQGGLEPVGHMSGKLFV